MKREAPGGDFKHRTEDTVKTCTLLSLGSTVLQRSVGEINARLLQGLRPPRPSVCVNRCEKYVSNRDLMSEIRLAKIIFFY